MLNDLSLEGSAWHICFRKDHSAFSVEDRLAWSRETSQKAIIVVVWAGDDGNSDYGDGDGEERSGQI